MLKTKINKTCPCGRYEIKLAVQSEEESIPSELFCPVCTSPLDEENDEDFIDE